MISSPFKCDGAVVTFPDVRIGGKLTIRVEKGTNKVHICIKDEPTSERADIFLEDGEAIDIIGTDVTLASKIKIVDISRNPWVYWVLT